MHPEIVFIKSLLNNTNPQICCTDFPALGFSGDLVQNKGVLCVIDLLLSFFVSESYLIKRTIIL